MSLPISDQ